MKSQDLLGRNGATFSVCTMINAKVHLPHQSTLNGSGISKHGSCSRLENKLVMTSIKGPVAWNDASI